MLLLGDCNDHLKEINDNSIDLILTDPPYGIEFMGKDWDKALVSTETWKECYRVLKQGKLAFVMCSPRQDVLARMIINLQDAGFRTNYSSIYWTYASGFPKAANVSKLIDKREGAIREVIGQKECGYIESHAKFRVEQGYRNTICKGDKVYDVTKSATEEAKKMEGAYVGFQPKPAVEVILVVSKGRTISWLDDCRIPYQSEDDKTAGWHKEDYGFGYREWSQRMGYDKVKKELERGEPPNEKGRFPANLLVSDDVLNNGKITKSSGGSGIKTREGSFKSWQNVVGGFRHPENETAGLGGYGDSGSYSRYFSLDSWAEKTLPFLIVPKASRSERNKGVETIEPVKVNDGRQTPIDNPFQRGETLRTNSHPTVKPLKLMSYLITMGSREGDLVLDPFCGSGTVCIAADQLHRKWIGIERNPEYAEIIKKRLMVPLSQLKLTIY